jgi:histone H3/H4
MAKNNRKDNALIKRKNLILKLNRAGVKRISPESWIVLNEYFKNSIESLFILLKQEIDVHGRKTAKKEDVVSAIKKLKIQEKNWGFENE